MSMTNEMSFNHRIRSFVIIISAFIVKNVSKINISETKLYILYIFKRFNYT